MWTPLKSERLILRPLEESDGARVITLIGDFDVARMLSRVPHPYTQDDFQSFYARQKEWLENGTDKVFMFAQAARETAGIIGCVGLHRNEDSALEGAWELGYWLGRPYWGQGYATEAANAAMAFGFQSLGIPVLTAGHFVDNPSSGRVLAKLGFRMTHEVDLWCVARNCHVVSKRGALTRQEWSERAV